MSGFGNTAKAVGAHVGTTALGLATNALLQKNNYKWAEKAAESDYNRQMALYNRMYEDKSPQNISKQLQEAGLNKALMYSGGASGVGGAASGASASTIKQFQTQSVGEKTNLALTAAQLRNVEAQTENVKADTLKKVAETATTEGTREEVIQELRQRGYGQWLDNQEREYKHKATSVKDTQETDHTTYGKHEIKGGSLFTQELAADIFEIQQRGQANEATAKLTTEKAKGYWTELMNSTKQADSAAIQAAAQKLAAEYNYGEEANWKWWTNKASEALKIIK